MLKAVTVVIAGALVASSQPAQLVGGRVVGPVDPFLARVADVLEYANGLLVARAGTRHATIRVRKGNRRIGDLVVPLGTLWRALGATVSYDATRRIVVVTRHARNGIETSAPRQTPAVAPRPVFSPPAVATPRPVFTGSPKPRRTPLESLP